MSYIMCDTATFLSNFWLCRLPSWPHYSDGGLRESGLIPRFECEVSGGLSELRPYMISKSVYLQDCIAGTNVRELFV